MSCGAGPLCHHQADCADLHCPGRPGRPVKVVRGCDELGLCQARTPRCAGCQFKSAAPMTIPTDRQISRWMKWALVWAVGTATVAALMFVAGALS